MLHHTHTPHTHTHTHTQTHTHTHARTNTHTHTQTHLRGFHDPVEQVLPFGQGGACGEQPAVAQDALHNVPPAGAVHKDGRVVGQLVGPAPGVAGQLLVGPPAVKEGGAVGRKVGVLEQRAGADALGGQDDAINYDGDAIRRGDTIMQIQSSQLQYNVVSF